LLEDEPASELHDSGIVGGGDLAEGAAGNVCIWFQELSVIEDVKELRSQLERGTFGDFGGLGQPLADAIELS